MDALICNLKKAAFDRESVTIAGGVFNPDELLDAAKLLAAAVVMKETIDDILGRESTIDTIKLCWKARIQNRYGLTF